MFNTCAAIAIGLIVAMAARLLAGRLAGLSITAICGATIAYLLPPAFSFRVSDPRDVAALALYGAVGLLLARPPSRRAAWPASPGAFPLADLPETQLHCVRESPLAEQLRQAGITLDAGGSLPWPRDLTLRMAFDLIETALLDSRVVYISVYGARCPARATLFVAAWRSRPGCPVTIGKGHDDCGALQFKAGPPHSRATSFDNGHARIYQASVVG